MGHFDELYRELMESMVMGGADSVMGNPATGGEIGSHGGDVGNKDFYAGGTAVNPSLLYTGIQTRNVPIPKPTSSRKKPRNKK